MTTITLAIQWRGHQPGDTVDVDNATAEWLRRTGAAAPEPSLETTLAAAPELDPERELETPADPEPALADEAPAAVPERPRKAAPVATWRAYAVHHGIDPKGLSKAEIIAATKDA
ncbi:hypothetical protein ACFWGD_11220 [Corynebacterium sp. NPDC060344]|uniref:hypothetical protein n=1 Tax=Corynebacterium sp. NPDC060344 TaxID=3347101 RepID=UPI003658B009